MTLVPDGLHDDRAMMERFLGLLPHAKALGMMLVDAGPGVVELDMAWQPDFVGDPRTGVLHGGVVSALMGGAARFALGSMGRGDVAYAPLLSISRSLSDRTVLFFIIVFFATERLLTGGLTAGALK